MNEYIFIQHLDEVIQFIKMMRVAGYLGLSEEEWSKKINDYAKHSENLKEEREWLMEALKDFELRPDDVNMSKESSRKYIGKEMNMYREIRELKRIAEQV